ncbi:C4-dicarboxylate/malic acid transporter, partial [Penicillium sp. DV-2018c]
LFSNESVHSSGISYPTALQKPIPVARGIANNLPAGRMDQGDTERDAAGGGHAHRPKFDAGTQRLSWKGRIRHITWAYFTMTMATGGVASVLHTVPYRFGGLYTIGVIVFILNVVLYLIIWTLMILRFYHYPHTFKASFLHPTESLFVPASLISAEAIMINIIQYGLDHTGPWLTDTISILFWFMAAMAVIFAAVIYLILWSTQTFTIAEMTPIWILPAYPLLLIGPIAGALCAKLTPPRSLPTILVGFAIQGIGFLVSLMVYSAFIYRLMSQKLPKETARPGMFVSVGPSAFTVSGILNMASQASRVFPIHFLGNGPLAASIFKVISDFAALWLWGLAIFFFFAATLSHWAVVSGGGTPFSMNWFSFVFPNTALVGATFAVGQAFSSGAIDVIGVVMVFPLILMWFFVCIMMMRAIYLKHILWPQKGEDKDEQGFSTCDRRPGNRPVGHQWA